MPNDTTTTYAKSPAAGVFGSLISAITQTLKTPVNPQDPTDSHVRKLLKTLLEILTRLENEVFSRLTGKAKLSGYDYPCLLVDAGKLVSATIKIKKLCITREYQLFLLIKEVLKGNGCTNKEWDEAVSKHQASWEKELANIPGDDTEELIQRIKNKLFEEGISHNNNLQRIEWAISNNKYALPVEHPLCVQFLQKLYGKTESKEETLHFPATFAELFSFVDPEVFCGDFTEGAAGQLAGLFNKRCKIEFADIKKPGFNYVINFVSKAEPASKAEQKSEPVPVNIEQQYQKQLGLLNNLPKNLFATKDLILAWYNLEVADIDKHFTEITAFTLPSLQPEGDSEQKEAQPEGDPEQKEATFEVPKDIASLVSLYSETYQMHQNCRRFLKKTNDYHEYNMHYLFASHGDKLGAHTSKIDPDFQQAYFANKLPSVLFCPVDLDNPNAALNPVPIKGPLNNKIRELAAVVKSREKELALLQAQLTRVITQWEEQQLTQLSEIKQQKIELVQESSVEMKKINQAMQDIINQPASSIELIDVKISELQDTITTFNKFEKGIYDGIEIGELPIPADKADKYTFRNYPLELKRARAALWSETQNLLRTSKAKEVLTCIEELKQERKRLEQEQKRLAEEERLKNSIDLEGFRRALQEKQEAYTARHAECNVLIKPVTEESLNILSNINMLFAEDIKTLLEEKEVAPGALPLVSMSDLDRQLEKLHTLSSDELLEFRNTFMASLLSKLDALRQLKQKHDLQLNHNNHQGKLALFEKAFTMLEQTLFLNEAGKVCPKKDIPESLWHFLKGLDPENEIYRHPNFSNRKSNLYKVAFTLLVEQNSSIQREEFKKNILEKHIGRLKQLQQEWSKQDVESKNYYEALQKIQPLKAENHLLEHTIIPLLEKVDPLLRRLGLLKPPLIVRELNPLLQHNTSLLLPNGLVNQEIILGYEQLIMDIASVQATVAEQKNEDLMQYHAVVGLIKESVPPLTNECEKRFTAKVETSLQLMQVKILELQATINGHPVDYIEEVRPRRKIIDYCLIYQNLITEIDTIKLLDMQLSSLSEVKHLANRQDIAAVRQQYENVKKQFEDAIEAGYFFSTIDVSLKFLDLDDLNRFVDEINVLKELTKQKALDKEGPYSKYSKPLYKLYDKLSVYRDEYIKRHEAYTASLPKLKSHGFEGIFSRYNNKEFDTKEFAIERTANSKDLPEPSLLFHQQMLLKFLESESAIKVYDEETHQQAKMALGDETHEETKSDDKVEIVKKTIFSSLFIQRCRAVYKHIHEIQAEDPDLKEMSDQLTAELDHYILFLEKETSGEAVKTNAQYFEAKFLAILLSRERIINRPTPPAIKLLNALIGLLSVATVGLTFLGKGIYSRATQGQWNFSIFYMAPVKECGFTLAQEVRDLVTANIVQDKNSVHENIYSEPETTEQELKC